MRGKLRFIFSFFIFMILIFISADSYSNNYGKIILCMYKSSDGYQHNNNPIKWYFEPEIKKLGLKVRYHDFDAGSPGHGSLADVRAILTWYNNSVVPDKKTGLRYIEFLNRSADSGIKIIIVNSFGVYGYKDNGKVKWGFYQYIKPLFYKLGFNFAGFWTSDPKKLRISGKVSSMVEMKGKQDVTRARYYQQIVPLRDDVETYLRIKRIDRVKGLGDGNSSVILTSGNGGFALEKYVLHGKKLLLNPALFLRRSLFHDNGYQGIGIILGNFKDTKLLKGNISYSCRYAKIHSKIIWINQLGSMVSEDLIPFEVLLIAADSVEQIPASLISRYVRAGGKVIFLKYADLNREFIKLLGLKTYGKKDKDFKEGFTIKSDFFMNSDSFTGKKIECNIREAKLAHGRVLAALRIKGERSTYPLLWERSLGKGKIMYWNTDLLFSSKAFRGTIVQSIHYIENGFVTGMANIAMMMIDDFPAPWWNTYYKKYRLKHYSNLLSKESNHAQRKRLSNIINNLKKYPDQSDTDFIRKVWIKDIQAFQKQFGFKYSSYLIFNYSNETGFKKSRDEFAVKDFYLAEDGLAVKMGKRVLENGWELGFHGYNHMSMTQKRPEEYASEPWPDRKSMVKALIVAVNEWVKIYGSSTLPFSYVAPHNIIDESGLSALGEVFPSIQVVSAVYIGDQGELEQEFEWTGNRRFFQIPRMTSGYYLDDSSRHILYDTVHNFGVISHFIHPDDNFDEYRSAGFGGWKWLKTEFIREFSLLKKNFPWVRWMTVKDAFSEFLFYDSINIRSKRKGKSVIIESSDGSDRYFYFRIRFKKNRKIVKLQNCTLVHQNRSTGDYIFKTRGHLAKIVLR